MDVNAPLAATRASSSYSFELPFPLSRRWETPNVKQSNGGLIATMSGGSEVVTVCEGLSQSELW